MSKQDMKVLRMNLLGGMHSYITKCISDEETHDSWLALGVPDEPTEEDLESIAEDDEDFSVVAYLFGNLVLDDCKSKYQITL